MFSNQIAFRQLVEEFGGHRLLKAPTPAWPSPWVPSNGNCRILGVAVEAKTRL